MSAYARYEAARGDGSNGASFGQQPSFAAQLRNTLNTIPAYTWYAVPSGGLAFVNEHRHGYNCLTAPQRMTTRAGHLWGRFLTMRLSRR
jgi:hypothetical protein